VTELNLELVSDLVSWIKVGEAGYAYVFDSTCRPITHPDLGLVLQDTDLTGLTQVQAGHDEPDPI